MKRAAAISSWIVRVCGAVQLVLGALIWFAPARNYVPLHMLSGTLFVLALLMLAVLGLRAAVPWPFGVFTILWTLALPAFGVRHASILIGPSHWIIRVTHLLMGMIAIGLGQRLAKQILQRAKAGVELAGAATSRAR